jgi:hypothetical protein
LLEGAETGIRITNTVVDRLKELDIGKAGRVSTNANGSLEVANAISVIDDALDVNAP